MDGNGLRIYSFQPVWLTLDQVGPFRESPYEIDFTDEREEPCNLFLLMSKNGNGKTTVLEILTVLMELFGQEYPRSFGSEDLDDRTGRVQWDVRVRLHWKGRDRAIMLSLLAGNLGEQMSLKAWGPEKLAQCDCEAWHAAGFTNKRTGLSLEEVGRGDELVQEIRALLLTSLGERPSDFGAPTLSIPTLMYFPAYRDIPSIYGQQDRPIVAPEHWGYRTTHRFEPHATRWTDSIDNLLVWMKWLDDGRFQKAVDFVNEHVFAETPKMIKGVRRDPPEAIVLNEGEEHRLDKLSSGEKNLVQLFLRIGAHMTQQSVILIDEPEVHLHPKLRAMLMRHLREFAKRHPEVTIIMATHSIYMLRAFGFESPEEGLRKGGEILQQEMGVEEDLD